MKQPYSNDAFHWYWKEGDFFYHIILDYIATCYQESQSILIVIFFQQSHCFFVYTFSKCVCVCVFIFSYVFCLQIHVNLLFIHFFLFSLELAIPCNCLINYVLFHFYFYFLQCEPISALEQKMMYYYYFVIRTKNELHYNEFTNNRWTSHANTRSIREKQNQKCYLFSLKNHGR